jgi:hypothetical protein
MDAKCLTWLDRLKNTIPKLHRWCLQIQGIDFSVQHKPGKDNVVTDALSRIILDFASKNTRGYALPDTLPSTILAPMLELIVEPYALFASTDTLASPFVEPSSLVQDRTNAGSDECVLTDLVASVATAFPDRDGIATAQRADAYFGPILSVLEHTSSVRSSIGNDYTSAVTCYIKYLVALRPNIIRPTVRSQFNGGFFVLALPQLLSWRTF